MKTEDLAALAKWAKETDLEEIVYKNGKEGFSFCEVWREERNFNFFSPLVNVNSPFVGIFRRSLPGRTLNLSEGDEVKKGEVLGYVETAQEHKEVVSPFDAFIRKVCLEDGACADFGAPLFFVEKK